MKKALLLFLLITATIGARAQDSTPQLPPDLDMLKFFYTLYMMPYVDGTKPTDLYRKQQQLRKRYCTARCMARYLQLIEPADAVDDPFIKAAGSDEAAIRSLMFAKVPKQPNKYTVTYDAGADKITVQLTLINDKGDWKIDYLE